MKTTLSAALGAMMALSLASAAIAHEYKLGDVEIGHPWTRATLPNAPVGGGYMTITNSGSEPVTLTGASTPAATSTEIHSMEMTDGVMTMGEVEGGLTVEPGASVSLEPGGYHIMLMGLEEPITEGANVPLTLEFSGGESLEVELAVEPVGATAPGGGAADDGAMEGMDHGHGENH